MNRSEGSGWWWTALGVAVVVLFVPYVAVLGRLIGPGIVYENQGITDFGRDLVGVRALEAGSTPYGQLGDLLADYGPIDLPQSGPPRESGWVVHPPVAIAGARLVLSATGVDRAEMTARRLGMVAIGLLAVALFSVLRGRSVPAAFVAAGVLVVWAPTFTDLLWIQGNAIAGLALLAVLLLDERDRRAAALLLLGVLVAWKPWLAVFALALPQSSSPWRDLLAVAGVAAAATILVLPYVGGFETLWAWITDALPANSVEARETPSNISWTAMAGPVVASTVYGVALVAIALGRRHVPRRAWPLLPIVAAVTVAPFVWDHYWVVLVPAVWWVARSDLDRLRLPVGAFLVLAVLPVALSVAGLPGLENRTLPMALAPLPLVVAMAFMVREHMADT